VVWVWVSSLSDLALYTHVRLNNDRAYSPFHAALGIATSRMLIYLQKFAARNLGPKVEEFELPNLEVDP
jgi:hypothetical protein